MTLSPPYDRELTELRRVRDDALKLITVKTGLRASTLSPFDWDHNGGVHYEPRTIERKFSGAIGPPGLEHYFDVIWSKMEIVGIDVKVIASIREQFQSSYEILCALDKNNRRFERNGFATPATMLLAAILFFVAVVLISFALRHHLLQVLTAA